MSRAMNTQTDQVIARERAEFAGSFLKITSLSLSSTEPEGWGAFLRAHVASS